MYIQIKNRKYIIVVASVIIVFLAGWSGHAYYTSNIANLEDLSIEIRQNSPDFHYINPLLFINNSEESFSEYNLLKKEINNYITSEHKKGKVEKVSVYFRDLNSSHWGGVNEDDLYAPSSMLKVAILISYLRLASQDPEILNKKVKYNYKETYGEYYKPKRLANGSYTVLEILQQMIIESDNTAMSALVSLHAKEIAELYKDLRLPSLLENPDDFMSAEDYSYIFRTLYNATYLRKSLSEQALKLLTFTTFDQGIVKGVNASTTVAHKFGEHTITVNGIVKERQLHDCGIVYYPKKPYLICIMTKGKDFSDLEKVIADLSRTVFVFIDEQNNNLLKAS